MAAVLSDLAIEHWCRLMRVPECRVHQSSTGMFDDEVLTMITSGVTGSADMQQCKQGELAQLPV